MKRFKSLVLALLVLAFTFGFGLLPKSELRALDWDKYPWRDKLFGRDLADVKVDGYAYYEEARKILAMVNELRASLGLHPLVYNAQLEAAAMQRAAETSILWSHMRPDGSFIYYTSPYSSENIAAGNITPEETFRQWVESPSHYEAMVNPNFISIGIGSFGSAKGDPPLWWSQVFSSVVGGTEFAEHEAVERYQPTVSLAPDILKLRARASEEFALSWEQSFEDGHFAYRMPPGREYVMRPYVHYDVDDEYQVMSLFVPDEWEWLNQSPELIEFIAADRVLAKAPGEAKVQIRLKAYPELSTQYYFKIVESQSFGLNAVIRPDLAKEIEAKMLEDTLAYQKTEAEQPAQEEELAEQDEELAEEGAETAEQQELVEPVELHAQWDSRLERYALEIAKHASLCESSNPVQDYPDLQMADHILDLSANYWWIYFSDADQPQDQKIILPSWAKAYAIVCLESAGQEYTAAVFSDADSDGVRAYSESEALRYQIAVYEDKADYDLVLQAIEISDETLEKFRLDPAERERFLKAAKAPVIEADPLVLEPSPKSLHQKLEQTESSNPEQAPLAFSLRMHSRTAAVQPMVDLDPSYIRYESADESVLKISPEGYFEPQSNGLVDVLVKVYDPLKLGSGTEDQPLIERRFQVQVDLQELRPTESSSLSSSETASETEDPGQAERELEQSETSFNYLYLLPLLILPLALLIYLISLKKKNSEDGNELDE